MHLELSAVTKAFDGVVALAGVDLSVQAGSTVALLGKSGCGKSTLLRTVIGLVQPDSGELSIDAERVPFANAHTLRPRTGYVIQEGGLFPHLTARANTTLMARHLKRPQAWISERVAELCGLVRLETDVLDRYPLQLSGGQRQRVSLMRSLMLDPDLLLLDEPLGALDPITRADLQSDLRTIFRRLQKAVILVTHDLGEAAFFADRILLMHEGRCLQQGSMRDLLERPTDPYVTRFVQAQRPLAEWQT